MRINGGALAKHRRSKPLTQFELANLSGVSVSTISDAELGKRNPRPSKIRALAAALDIDVDALRAEEVA